MLEKFIGEDLLQHAAPDVLARKHGDNRLRVMRDMPRNVLLDFSKDNYRDMSLAEFVRFLESPERTDPCYANQQSIDKFPSLAEHVSFESIMPGLRPTFVWFSSADANIGLHFDASDSYLAQLHGRKRFFLIRHRDSGKVYPFRDDVTRSVVDLRHVAPEEHPRIMDVAPYAGELVPGDLLYVPLYTWHYFWGISTSVSVSAFHRGEVTPKRILNLLRMYGARYSLGVLSQMVRHGMFGAAFEERGYGWPPFGLILWKMMTGQFEAWEGERKKVHSVEGK